MYQELLADADIDVLRQAIAQIMRTDDFFPSVGRIWQVMRDIGIKPRELPSAEEVLIPKKWDDKTEKVVPMDGSEKLVGIDKGIEIINKVLEEQGRNIQLKDTDTMESVVKEIFSKTQKEDAK